MEEQTEIIVAGNGALTKYRDYLNFEGMFQHAMEAFSEQMLTPKKNISLLDIEITKAKGARFSEVLGNIMALSHDLEIMSAEKDRFARKDELALMNNLRKQCEIQADLGLKNMQIAQKKLEDCEDMEIEDIVRLQAVLDANIESTQKVIASASRLIQLERYSGNRPWGARQSKPANISYIQKLEESKDPTTGGSTTKGKNTPTRKISIEEMDVLGVRPAEVYDD
jgi:hypothetical protein